MRQQWRGGLKFLLMWCTTALQFPVIGQSKASDVFDSAMAKLESEVADVNFVPVQLDFAYWVELQLDTQPLSLTQIQGWQQQLAQLPPETVCQNIRHENLQLHLTLLKNRQKLVSQLPTSSRYSDSFATFPNGKQWYLHWLNAWLLLDGTHGVTPEHVVMLKELARQELQAVHPEYTERVAQSKASKPLVHTKQEKDKIVAALRQREKQVLTHLSEVFANLPDFPEVQIQPSSLPESFPAPGIYDYQNQVFYYHFTNNALLAQSLDWLYLHEAVPGHHMQMSLVNQAPLCPASGFMAEPMVSIEGWGAWVETLGQELGLYTEPGSLAYALEWRVLRALRVLMDIGIHYEGWDDSEALNLWKAYLPDHVNIGRREINRIRRWPVQVITYIYGKYRIETALAQLQSNSPDVEKRHIHSLLLQLSNQPPHALEWLPVLIAPK